MVTKVSKTKKKVKKNVPSGIAHINSTFNNTIITITDTTGDTISWSSSGNKGFKGSRKSPPFAAQLAAEEAGIKTVLSDPYKNTSVTENNESQDSKKVSKVVIRDDKGKILILQRSEGENNWDLPGGHIHYGESQLEGCKRN